LLFTISKWIALGLFIPSDFPSILLKRFPSGDITTTLSLPLEATCRKPEYPEKYFVLIIITKYIITTQRQTIYRYD
jgi:hypothetical protein